MPTDLKTQLEELPQEQRGISSINQTSSSTLKRAGVMLGILIFCAILGVLYWNYRHHTHHPQEAAQKDLRLTSAVPRRTFIDLPTAQPAPAEPPPLPKGHGFNLSRNQHIMPSSRTQRKEKPPLVLDKSDSSLMATSTGAVRESQPVETVSVGTVSEEHPHGMEKRLSGTSTPARQAEQLKDRNFILAKGSFIDCALQTKLDSTVPGMTACVVTRNIYSDNGRVVLIERGSTVSGEYKANLRQGMARLFILWTRIKTPHGVIINLDSPGTDQLGGAGVPGYVDNHFWQRFGGALLLSLLDDAADVASSRLGGQKDGQISFNETVSSTQDMATESLKNSINIPPTLYKNQGEQIGIYVARDLDFSSVYDVAND